MNTTVKTIIERPRQTVKEFLKNASCGDAFAVRQNDSETGSLACYVVVDSNNNKKLVCEARGSTLFDAESLLSFSSYRAYPAEVEMTFTVNIG